MPGIPFNSCAETGIQLSRHNPLKQRDFIEKGKSLFYFSIHSNYLSFTIYPWSGHRGNKSRRETQTTLSSVTLSGFSWVIQRPRSERTHYLARSGSTTGSLLSEMCPENLQGDSGCKQLK